jgi:hypothetical protein
MNEAWHTMDCKVIFAPVQPDRFYMDMSVYRIVRVNSLQPAGRDESKIWRGIYLAVEMKPWMDTGHHLRKS